MNRALLTLLVGFGNFIVSPRPLHKVFILILGNLLYNPLKRNKISKKILIFVFRYVKKGKKKSSKANVIASAQIIFDSGIAWFWSDEKIKKNINYEIKGIESLVNEQKNNNGVLLFFKHSLHLELDARLLGMNSEVYGVERVHNSELFDAIQKKGRLKSVKDTCDKNNPIKFLRWLKKGKTVLFATDLDFGLNQSDVINFFAQPAATISAPSKIINQLVVKHIL